MSCTDLCAEPGDTFVGWDIGGAHVKASLLVDGRLRDVAQWAAPLWQGLAHLDAAVDAAHQRWRGLDRARHGVTMTAEMTDLFAHREAGVLALTRHLTGRLGPATHFFAGPTDWPVQASVAARWRAIASANWLATANLIATRWPDALLVDIGSTTTDLIPIRDGQPRPTGSTDAERLASGELVYLGVVRTPLCALARQIRFAGRQFNVMNEFFASTADVFRLSGELDPAHDQHPPADGSDKSQEASRCRLARMIGMDARDAPPDAWRDFADSWRQAMFDEIDRHLTRVAQAAALPAGAPLVGAGSGLFLVRELATRGGRPYVPFHTLVSPDATNPDWANTCAPSVAVALLLERWSRSCGS